MSLGPNDWEVDRCEGYCDRSLICSDCMAYCKVCKTNQCVVCFYNSERHPCVRPSGSNLVALQVDEGSRCPDGRPIIDPQEKIVLSTLRDEDPNYSHGLLMYAFQLVNDPNNNIETPDQVIQHMDGKVELVPDEKNWIKIIFKNKDEAEPKKKRARLGKTKKH